MAHGARAEIPLKRGGLLPRMGFVGARGPIPTRQNPKISSLGANAFLDGVRGCLLTIAFALALVYFTSNEFGGQGRAEGIRSSGSLTAQTFFALSRACA